MKMERRLFVSNGHRLSLLIRIEHERHFFLVVQRWETIRTTRKSATFPVEFQLFVLRWSSTQSFSFIRELLGNSDDLKNDNFNFQCPVGRFTNKTAKRERFLSRLTVRLARKSSFDLLVVCPTLWPRKSAKGFATLKWWSRWPGAVQIARTLQQLQFSFLTSLADKQQFPRFTCLLLRVAV